MLKTLAEKDLLNGLVEKAQEKKKVKAAQTHEKTEKVEKK